MSSPEGTLAAQIASGFATGLGSSVYSIIFPKLPSLAALALKEIGLILNFEDELRKMHRTLLKVQDLVDHVDNNPLRFTGGSGAWQLLFEDLQKLSYDADALLDQVCLHLIQPSDEGHQKSFSVRSITLKSGERLVLPHEIKEMKKKLHALAEEMNNLLHMEQVKTALHKWKAVDRSWFGSDHCLDNSSSILFDEETILGRQEDKKNVIQLLSANNNDDLSVVPLVAMGGMGKTALAQLVYNDDEFSSVSKFDHKIWISVSADFDIGRITKSIIESVTKTTCKLCDLDSLQRKLHHVISNKKFLLVLDDYWNENFSDWDLLSAPLRYRTQGSKVIVTTRSSMVSSIVRSGGEEYHPEKLTDELCWELMKKRALFRKEESEKSFESLGMDIARKCKGSPLVAKTLGNVLHHKSTHDEWRCIANSDLWDLPQYENWVLHSLMLSYVHLPAPLRKCFAYCSLFPQDHVFEADQLVLFWMAEGFIQPQGERRLEDIGKDYFNNLCMRSFFHTAGGNGKYKMHSLLHDLARLVSTNTCSQVKCDLQNSYPLFGNACHLSLLNSTTGSFDLSSSKENKRLRTFMVVPKRGSTPEAEIKQGCFSNLKFLRTLSLCNIGLKELPESIGKLIYLRCLNLCKNYLQRLPESICELAALQTLMLEGCEKLEELPEDMQKVSNLRHLRFEVVNMLRPMPPDFRKLTHLQTLSAFIVSKSKGRGIEELEKMDLLTGSLCIKNTERVSADSASKAKMKEKKYLNKLKLQFEMFDANARDNQLRVLENLEPHENLEELEIRYYSGTKCPAWLGDPRHNFTKIHLQRLVKCDALPSLWQLPFLKSLCIEGMHALECIDESFYGEGSGEKFPSLENLEVCEMTGLFVWQQPKVVGCMPRLTTFKVELCPVLLSLPKQLGSIPPETSGCDKLPKRLGSTSGFKIYLSELLEYCACSCPLDRF